MNKKHTNKKTIPPRTKVLWVIIGLLGIGILFYLFTGNISSTSQSTKQNTIQIVQGKEFLTQFTQTPNAVLLDIRTPEEYSAGHIADAVNIDFYNESFSAQIKALDVDKTYFVYCRSGNRSAQAVRIMKNAGIKNIVELQGGIMSNTSTVPLVSGERSEVVYVVDASDLINTQTTITDIKKSEISEKEVVGLVQMREEEKLAHDVYITLGTIWGSKVFSNIASSEQTHTHAVKTLLDKYDITDPVVDSTIGVFASKPMQELYNEFIAQGKKSFVNALVVGATIEDLDIRDLDILKKETTKEDILVVYNNLQKGSRNHMRAFVKNIQAYNGIYTPQYISDSQYHMIINSEQEKGMQ